MKGASHEQLVASIRHNVCTLGRKEVERLISTLSGNEKERYMKAYLELINGG